MHSSHRSLVIECLVLIAECTGWLSHSYICEGAEVFWDPIVDAPAGWMGRSMIKRHLFGWWFLGMTPNLLMCASGIADLLNGPVTR